MPASAIRRRMLSLAAFCLVAAGAWFLWRAFRVEPDSLVVAEYTIPVPGWPASADGLRIAAVGDIHAGAPFIDEAKLAALTARINAAHPDLVIWLGDYVIQGVLGGTFMEPERVARLLSSARGRLGTFAIIGNHDRWLDSARVGRAFEAAGISFLRWQEASIRVAGTTVHLYGLDDFELSPGFWPRFRAVHEEWKSLPADEPLIALSHNPDVFFYMPTRVNLTLASHTHGGQVRLPLIGSPVVPSSLGQRYARGLIVEKDRPMFVNTGIGTSIIPIRFGVPPEISILTLRSPAPGR
jgi:predicted MPP superfamily phosphohydrolase